MSDEIVPVKKGQQTMANSNPVVVASDQSAIPITGTVTVDTSALATSANQTNGNQKSQIVDGAGDVADVVPLSTQIVDADKGIVTNTVIHGRTTAGGGSFVDVKVTPSGALSVDATVAGSATVIQGTATNLKTQAESYQGGVAVSASNPLQVTLANTGANATAVKVDGSAVTQPISGSVTANAGTNLNTSALALESGGNLAAIKTAQTDKSQFTKITDGTDTALVTAAGELNVLPTAQPGVDIGDVTINNAAGASAVNIQDGGNSITVDSTQLPSALGQTTMSASLPVTIASNQTAVPISGTVTVDTSLLATAAKQDTGNTSLSSIDTKLTSGGQKAQIVDPSNNAVNSLSAGTGMNGLMVAIGATNYVVSTLNSSTTQLNAGQSFVGAIEPIFNAPSISVLLTSDQDGVLYIYQYIDASGVYKIDTFTIPIKANYPLAQSFAINGNYINIVFQNTSNATTTTFNLNVAYGTIAQSTNLNNTPSSINEINGYVVDSNFGKSSNGTQRMTIAIDQQETYSDSLRRQYLERQLLMQQSNFYATMMITERASSNKYGYEIR